MKLETSRYVLEITESWTTFNKYNYTAALSKIKKLKQEHAKKDGRLSEDVQDLIQSHRNVIKSTPTRIYRCRIRYKKYMRKKDWTFFDVEIRFDTFARLLKKKIQRELTAYRKQLKESIEDTATYFHDERYQCKVIGSRYIKGGWIHKEPGQILRIYKQRMVKDLYTLKVPTKPYRYIGLELEFCAPIDELDFALLLHKEGVHQFGQMKKDGSLRPKLDVEHGYELALLFPEQHFKQHLKKVCNILQKVGARADNQEHFRRCGLHVHIDMRRGRKKDIVYNNFVACQKVLSTFLDPNRSDSEFCRLIKSREFPTKFENTREERYKAINAASFYKYQTLEIRMHQGSVNFKDICNWMNLLIKIANYKKRIRDDINELTILKKRFRINPAMSEFFQDKICFWQLQGPQRRSNPFQRATTTERRDTPPQTATQAMAENVAGIIEDGVVAARQALDETPRRT